MSLAIRIGQQPHRNLTTWHQLMRRISVCAAIAGLVAVGGCLEPLSGSGARPISPAADVAAGDLTSDGVDAIDGVTIPSEVGVSKPGTGKVVLHFRWAP